MYKERVLVGELTGDLDAARFEPELRDLIERARAGPSPPEPLRLVGFGATRRAFDEAPRGPRGGAAVAVEGGPRGRLSEVEAEVWRASGAQRIRLPNKQV